MGWPTTRHWGYKCRQDKHEGYILKRQMDTRQQLDKENKCKLWYLRNLSGSQDKLHEELTFKQTPKLCEKLREHQKTQAEGQPVQRPCSERQTVCRLLLA